MMSYKGVVINGVKEGDDSRRYLGKTADYKGKGKGKMVETREERGYKPADFRGKPKVDGEGTSSSWAPPVEQGKRYGGPIRGISRGGDDHNNEQKNHENGNGRERRREEGPTETLSPNHLSAVSSLNQYGKKVRKELKFDDDDEGLELETLMVKPAEAVTGLMTESMAEMVMEQMGEEEKTVLRSEEQIRNGESETMINDIDSVQGSEVVTGVVVPNDKDDEEIEGMEQEENEDRMLLSDDDGEELEEANGDLGSYDQPPANE